MVSCFSYLYHHKNHHLALLSRHSLLNTDEEIIDCDHLVLGEVTTFSLSTMFQYSCLKPCARRPVGCTTEAHKCPLTCSETCGTCTIPVVKRLQCGHTTTVPCQSTDLTCYLQCERKMACGHRCQKMCWQECGDCPVMVRSSFSFIVNYKRRGTIH